MDVLYKAVNLDREQDYLYTIRDGVFTSSILEEGLVAWFSQMQCFHFGIVMLLVLKPMGVY